MAENFHPDHNWVGVVLGALYVLATGAGVPVSVALMALLGALIAVSNAERRSWSFASVIEGLTTLAASLALGLFGARIFGYVVFGPLLKAVSADPSIPASAADPVAALAIAMYGQRYFEPMLKALLGRWLPEATKKGD